QAQLAQSRTEELDELADNALLPQHLCDGQHEVGRGAAFLHLSVQAESQHLGNSLEIGLPEQASLALDTAAPPSHNAEPVDHCRVRIGSDQRVRVSVAIGIPEYHRRQILEVDLMDNAGIRRHDAKILKGGLGPAEKAVALAVALIFEQSVRGES